MAIEDYQSQAPSSHQTGPVSRHRTAAAAGYFVASLVAGLLVVDVTHAAGNVSVRYRAPAACPDQRTFESELDRRLGDAPRPNTVLDVDVSVNDAAPEATRVHGRLLRDGRPLRQLEGGTCDEVVKALALVAALAILPPEPGAEPVAPPDPAGSGAEGRADPRPKRAGADDVSPPPPPPRGAIFVGLGGFVDGFTGPDPAFGGNLAVQVRLPGPKTAPLLFVDASYALPRESTVGAVRSDFTRLGGRVGTCPLGVTLGPFLARPCAGLSVDRVHGESSGIAVPRTANAVFASGHLFGKLTHAFWADRLAVGLSAGVVIPFAPPLFIVEDPVVEVHQVPRVSFLGQLDLAIRVF